MNTWLAVGVARSTRHEVLHRLVALDRVATTTDIDKNGVIQGEVVSEPLAPRDGKATSPLCSSARNVTHLWLTLAKVVSDVDILSVMFTALKSLNFLHA